eukprot:12895649-Prorocentrum_lima.AAC.1
MMKRIRGQCSSANVTLTLDNIGAKRRCNNDKNICFRHQQPSSEGHAEGRIGHSLQVRGGRGHITC